MNGNNNNENGKAVIKSNGHLALPDDVIKMNEMNNGGIMDRKGMNGQTTIKGDEIIAMNGDVWKTETSKEPLTVEAPSAGKVRLSWRQRGCYSIGHVFNDLCASMWFSYALLFYNSVLGFSNSDAGTLFLIGQVADAISTPFVGLASDKQNNLRIFRYGRRKTWHVIGSICVTVSFPFLFIKCLGCEHTVYSMQMIYFASFIILFQFGWASVQVAHLSLIPDLTKNPNERTELSAYRNAFTVISSICVYVIAWIILGDSSETTIGPYDKVTFRDLALIVTGIGIVFSIVFHIGVQEPKLAPKSKAIKENAQGLEGNSAVVDQEQPAVNEDINANVNNMTWKTWLKTLEFYKIGLLYMCTRLFVNLSQTYISFYLQDTLNLPKDSVAYIPLVVYVSGFLASMVMKRMNKKAGRTASYVIGAIIALGFCFWVLFGKGPKFAKYEIYGVAVLMGIGGNVMLVTCLGITADLIGGNTRSGAFVYGTMSFADKLSNGVVVAIVQNLNSLNGTFYRDMLAFGCGIPAVIALITVFTVKTIDLKTPKPSMADAVTPYTNGDIQMERF